MHIDNTIPLTWLVAGSISLLSFAIHIYIRMHIHPLVQRISKAEEALLQCSNHINDEEFTKELDKRFDLVDSKLREEKNTISELRKEFNEKFSRMDDKMDKMLLLLMDALKNNK